VYVYFVVLNVDRLICTSNGWLLTFGLAKEMPCDMFVFLNPESFDEATFVSLQTIVERFADI
jgi:hypothetical protein